VLTLGNEHACTITAGAMMCWGSNNLGQVGIGMATGAPSPMSIAGSWSAVTAGAQHTCGIHADKTLACWGDNLYGELGSSAHRLELSPTAVGADADWLQVSAGYSHTCGIRAGGSLWCWGNDNSGQLGVGTAWHTALVQIE